MRLTDGAQNRIYIIHAIDAREEGMKDFLMTLGCFPGESISLVSRMSSQYVINVKDSRYSIDENLAQTISICDLSVNEDENPRAI